MSLHKLVGATIIDTAYYREILYISTDHGVFKCIPYAGGSEECYIYHMVGSKSLEKGAVVKSVKDIKFANAAKSINENVSKTWGYLIETCKGYCSIEIRVDHSDYYGGSLEVKVLNTNTKIPDASLNDF